MTVELCFVKFVLQDQDACPVHPARLYSKHKADAFANQVPSCFNLAEIFSFLELVFPTWRNLKR